MSPWAFFKTLELGKKFIYPGYRPPPAFVPWFSLGDLQVVAHRQIREDPLIIRDDANAQTSNRIRWEVADLFSLKFNTPGLGRSGSHDGPQSGGLSGSGPAQSSHQLSFP